MPEYPYILRNGKPVVPTEPPPICEKIATIEDRLSILRNEIAAGSKKVEPDLIRLIDNMDKSVMLMLFGADYETNELWRT